jgi:hypothetical protein
LFHNCIIQYVLFISSVFSNFCKKKYFFKKQLVLEIGCDGYYNSLNFLGFCGLIGFFIGPVEEGRTKMETVHKLLIVVLVCGFFVFAGCGQQAGIKNIERICISGLDRTEAVEVSEGVLRDMNFMVAKADSEAGYVQSRPLAGGQFFEFWRKDNVGSLNSAESNLHSIRRTVELKMEEEPQEVCINCRVIVERLSMSEAAEKGVGIKYDRITGQRIRTSVLRLEPEAEQKQWIELGNDAELATAILKQIEKKASEK